MHHKTIVTLYKRYSATRSSSPVRYFKSIKNEQSHYFVKCKICRHIPEAHQKFFFSTHFV